VRYREPVLGPGDLVVAVSQSGETLDTIAAVRAAKERGAHVLAVANVVDSAIPRASGGAFYTHAGPEIGVASTKCFTTQLVTMLLLAVYLGRRRGVLDEAGARRILDALSHAPQQMREALGAAEHVRAVAKRHMKSKGMLFLGRGTCFPIALEGALKLKEISYIHAEGFAAGEMKHGPIALIDESAVVVAIATRGRLWEKVMANIAEVKARGATVVVVCGEGDEETKAVAEEFLEIPVVPELLSPAVAIVPLQALAYGVARARGNDVDRPRNLAKVVTVE
jgi:glucosamine--fructose-6-phosphate aminotransferase (isomerizing)